jgi:hypothetical protein
VEWYPEELELQLAEKVLREYFNGETKKRTHKSRSERLCRYWLDESEVSLLERRTLEELSEDFHEQVVGYDPEDMAKGGEVKNRMKKPVKKSNGGMMNKGTKVRGQGAAIRGTKFKGVF